MFCSKCGTEIKNGGQFCPKCGNKVEIAIPVNATTNNNTLNKPKGKRILAVLAAALVLVVGIVSIFSIGGKGYKKPIDTFYKAVEKQDIEILRTALAQYWIDYQTADYDGDGFLGEHLEDIINDCYDDYDYGDSVKVSYRITNVQKANKDELASLKKNIYDWYAYYITNEDKFNASVKDAVIVSVSQDVTGTEGSGTFTTRFLVIKENSKWKITVGYLDNSFYSN